MAKGNRKWEIGNRERLMEEWFMGKWIMDEWLMDKVLMALIRTDR